MQGVELPWRRGKMKKTIKINEIDYTDFFTPEGYTVSYKKIRGKNSGYMMDGSYTDDVLATKAAITCICMPLNEERLSEFLTAVSDTYLNIYFYDPKVKKYRTAEMMPSEPAQKFRGTGADLMDYWTGTVMQFAER